MKHRNPSCEGRLSSEGQSGKVGRASILGATPVGTIAGACLGLGVLGVLGFCLLFFLGVGVTGHAFALLAALEVTTLLLVSAGRFLAIRILIISSSSELSCGFINGSEGVAFTNT